MRPKKSALEHRILVEELFDQLAAAQRKLPPRRLLVMPTAHELHSHLIGGYNIMNEAMARAADKGKRIPGKRAEDYGPGTDSDTDQSMPRRDKGVKKKRKKGKKKRRNWVPLWDGEVSDVAEYLAKAVNMTTSAVEALLEKRALEKDKEEPNARKPSVHCSKYKTVGCPFKCQVTITETGAAIVSLGAHKHEDRLFWEGKLAITEPLKEPVTKGSAPVPESPSLDSEDDSPRRLKLPRTEDLEVPISSPSLLPFPSTADDNSAALQSLGAWKPPQPLTSEEEGSEGDEPPFSDCGEPEVVSEQKLASSQSLEPEDRTEADERMDDDEEVSIEPRVNDHVMFAGFENEESTPYHGISNFVDDVRTIGSEEDEEGDEDEGDA